MIRLLKRNWMVWIRKRLSCTKKVSKISPSLHFVLKKKKTKKQKQQQNNLILGNALKLIKISINLLVVYRESVNLIGYITRRLSAVSIITQVIIEILALSLAENGVIFRYNHLCRGDYSGRTNFQNNRLALCQCVRRVH